MGIVRNAMKLGFPVSRVGMGVWAWNNRRTLTGWANFAAGAPVRLLDPGERADLLAEVRLRSRLTADHRTRNLHTLRVAVDDGVATLEGLVPREAHDAAVAIATSTTGVRRVRDHLVDRPRRRWGARHR